MSYPVLDGQTDAWDKNKSMLPNGHSEMAANRSQNNQDFSSLAKNRWPSGDEGSLQQVKGTDITELERSLQGMTFDRDEFTTDSKKLWDDDRFLGTSQWGEPDAGVAQSLPVQSETGALGLNMAEYVLSSSPGAREINTLKPYDEKAPGKENDSRLKPTSPLRQENALDVDETGSNQNGMEELDTMKMAKADSRHGVMNNRFRRQRSGQVSPSVQGQGVVQGNAYSSPMKQAPTMQPAQQTGAAYSMASMPMGDPSLAAEAAMMGHPMEGAAGDPTPFGYGEHPFFASMSMHMNQNAGTAAFDHGMMGLSSDRMQGPYGPYLTPQQQFILAQQQQALAGNMNPMAAGPVMFNGQEGYAIGIPIAAGMDAARLWGSTASAGPTMVPQYYGFPAGSMVYPMVQQQGGGAATQQGSQGGHGGKGQGGRPSSPGSQAAGPGDGMGGQGGLVPPNAVSMMGPSGGGYQLVAPTAYYDSNGQLVMTGPPSGPRGPMPAGAFRFFSPMLMPGQPQPGPRMMGQQNGPQQNATPPLSYSGSQNNPNSMTECYLGFGSGSGLGGPNQPTNSLFGGPSNTFGLTNPNQQSNFSNTPFDSFSAGSTRRDSVSSLHDLKPPRPFFNAGASPGTFGLMQSLTPPPLSSSNSNIFGDYLNNLAGTQRYVSPAPGAELNKEFSNEALQLRGGSFGVNGGLLGGPPHRPLFSRGALLPGGLGAGGRLFRDAQPIGRSQLLEDFRNNRVTNLQLTDLINHFVEFSMDQHGSRFIQQKLERATASEKDLVFREVLPNAYTLMVDVFGNYVIQKFFEFGSHDQKRILADHIRGHVLELALQMYGCRVIQKALESIPPEQQMDMAMELKGSVEQCINDQNGNHVIQKCIECCDPREVDFIVQDVVRLGVGTVAKLSCHPYGCRVIQRILEHCTPEQVTPILDELHRHTEELVQDQYGNYVIQHVLENGRTEDKSRVVQALRGKVLALSQHKFASNVVEKCVQYSTRQERYELIQEVMGPTSADNSASPLFTMMKDQFANYVVQKMIDASEASQRKQLITRIRPHVQTLRKFTYGKHIIAKLEKHMNKSGGGAADLGALIATPANGALL